MPAATGLSSTPLPSVGEELNSDPGLAFNRAGLVITSRDYSHPDPPPNPPSPTTDSDLPQHNLATVKSDIPALDHFPVPPVHFPLPHLQKGLTSSLDSPVGKPSLYGRQMTLPALRTQESPDFTPTTPTERRVETATHTPSSTSNKRVDTSTYLSAPSHSDPYQTPSSTDLSTNVLTTDNTDFGIRQLHSPPSPGSLGSSNLLPKGSPRSSGVVLAMRNRFAQNVSYDRCIGTIQKLNFIVCVFGSIKRNYDFYPSSTSQCVNHRQSLSTQW